MANRDALEAEMNAVLKTKTTNDWVEVLEAAGCTVRPGLRLRATVRRPAGAPPRAHAICERPGIGRGAAHPHPVKIGEGVRVRNVAPKLGEHHAEIFGRLGVSQAEMTELRAKGVL